MRLSFAMASLLLCLEMSTSPAQGAVKLCVEIKASKSEKANIEKLVASELAHHPDHRVAKRDCESTLKVDFFTADGVRYLTVRINREIPVRFTYRTPSDLHQKISEAITRVLGQDPVYLQKDITRYSGVQRALHSILKRGHNRYRVELFQILTTNGDEALGLPGAAFAISRGSKHWRVFSRIYFGGDPQKAVARKLLKACLGADVGLTYEFSARDTGSFYLSAGFGAQLLYYEGRLTPKDPSSQTSAHKLGATFSLRVGYRLFRASDFDIDLFSQGYLPLFLTRDPDSTLINSYTPSFVAGVGVGF
ncbi:MAG: hypothetical protein KAI47_26510 [Deltaproteobacteria bacterium]|nr:hypothetical protein [Deltaproteobacteria bacterium]